VRSPRGILRESLIAGAQLVLGRKYLFRIGEALSLSTRLETEQQAQRNGEELVERIVAEAVPPSEELTAIDVGANVGAWSEALARFRGEGRLRVHAFEPAPEVAALLRRRLAPFGDRIAVNEAAAAEEDGTKELFFRPDNILMSSVLDFRDGATQRIAVPAVRLDTYASERGIDRVHLLKVDAEGYDMEVLRGAAALLRERRVGVVQFEYNFRWIFSRHFVRDAFELLEPFGYRLGKVTPRGLELYRRWQPLMESFHHTNFLACLPAWLSRFPAVEPPWPE
jgi:FkbM family methyltransferase